VHLLATVCTTASLTSFESKEKRKMVAHDGGHSPEAGRCHEESESMIWGEEKSDVEHALR
jgi:hypothetical protein